MQSVPSPHPPFRPLGGGGWVARRDMDDISDYKYISFYEKAYYQVYNFLFKSRKQLVLVFTSKIISLLTENQRIPRGTCHS